MTTATTRLWQTELLRGSVTLLFGVIFLLFHVHTLHLLLSLIGGYLVLDGLTDLIGLLTRHGVYRRAWLDGWLGVGSCLLGALTFVWPHITLFFLLRLLAIRLALRGATMLRQAWRGRGTPAGVTWLSGWVHFGPQWPASPGALTRDVDLPAHLHSGVCHRRWEQSVRARTVAAFRARSVPPTDRAADRL